MEKDFYQEQSPSSRIKASIVAEYFPQYCRILLSKPQPQLRYLDLFAGPGIYEDQKHSTPLLIAKACAEDPKLINKVHLMFNDKEYSDQLKQNLEKFYPPGTFTFEPRYGDKTVGESKRVHNYLIKEPENPNPHPTLLFFDPWGYKGIDTLALAKFLNNWGNELFLFVNIKRIHAAIENDKFDELMKLLFPTTIDKIRKDRKYDATSVYERLALIMSNLASEFKKAVDGDLYDCAFKFQEEDSKATSHFIIHFTKHPRGYELIKQIYYDFDNIGATLDRDGNYTFDAKRMDVTQDQLNFGDSNVEALSEKLAEQYKGSTISARKLFDEHQILTRFCGSHYAKTLRYMVDKGKVESRFKDDLNHRVTVILNDNCELKFV